LIGGKTDLELSVESSLDGDIEDGRNGLDLRVVWVGLIEEVGVSGFHCDWCSDGRRDSNDSDNRSIRCENREVGLGWESRGLRLGLASRSLAGGWRRRRQGRGRGDGACSGCGRRTRQVGRTGSGTTVCNDIGEKTSTSWEAGLLCAWISVVTNKRGLFTDSRSARSDGAQVFSITGRVVIGR